MPVRGNCGVSRWSLNSGKGLRDWPPDDARGEGTRAKKLSKEKEGTKEARMKVICPTYEGEKNENG